VKLNRVHNFLVYAGHVKLLYGNLHTIKKNKNVLIDSKEVCAEVNSLKTQECIHVLSTECRIKSQQKDS
jgi:hypothetical protein